MKKYNFKIDHNSKRIKVCENKEQRFRLVTITHCGYLYISLNHLRRSLNISNLSALKKSLLKLSTNSLCNVMIINNTKAKIMPFVKDFILMRYLENKRNLCRNSKKQAFIEWFKNEVEQKSLSKNEVKEFKEGVKILQETEQMLIDEMQQRQERKNKEYFDNLILENKAKHILKNHYYNENFTSINNKNKDTIYENFYWDERMKTPLHQFIILLNYKSDPYSPRNYNDEHLASRLEESKALSKFNGEIAKKAKDKKILRQYIITLLKEERIFIHKDENGDEKVYIKDKYYTSNNEEYNNRIYHELIGELKERWKWQFKKDEIIAKCEAMLEAEEQGIDFDFTELIISADKFISVNNLKESRQKKTQLQTFQWKNSTLDYGILNGEPVFSLNYIGSLLDIKNPRMSIDTNDSDYVVKIDNSIVSFAYNRKLHNTGELFLTEAGLYRLLLRSDKPEAEKFSKWVVKEVLPAIRKNSNDIKDRDKFLPKVENNQNALTQTFENSNIEIIMKEDSPYFKLADIEKVLELSDSASSRWIKDGWFDEDELTLWNSQGGGLPRNYVAESGLYRILNRTNSPKARPFERWVTKEVLPAIRKTGRYETYKAQHFNPQVESLEQIKIQALQRENELLRQNNELLVKLNQFYKDDEDKE